MSRMQAPVLLVGSLPFDTVEEALRVSGEALGGYVSCLPDGEVGSRKNWVGFLATDIFAAHPDLELARKRLEGFGISSVCGNGRVDPGELVEALQLHRACAEAAMV